MEELTNIWLLPMNLRLEAHCVGNCPPLQEPHEEFAAALTNWLLVELIPRTLRGDPRDRDPDIANEVYLYLDSRIRRGRCLLLTAAYMRCRILDARRRLEWDHWQLGTRPFAADEINQLADRAESVEDLPATADLVVALHAVVAALPVALPRTPGGGFTVPAAEVYRLWEGYVRRYGTPRGFQQRHADLFQAVPQPSRTRALLALLGRVYAGLRRRFPGLPAVPTGGRGVWLRRQMNAILVSAFGTTVPRPPRRRRGGRPALREVDLFQVVRDATELSCRPRLRRRLLRLVRLYHLHRSREQIEVALYRGADNRSPERRALDRARLVCDLGRIVRILRGHLHRMGEGAPCVVGGVDVILRHGAFTRTGSRPTGERAVDF